MNLTGDPQPQRELSQRSRSIGFNGKKRMARKDVLRTDYRRVCALAHLLSSVLKTALTTESPSLHLSFSGSSSVATPRTERVQSRQIAGPLFLPPRSIPAGLSPRFQFRYPATG